MDPISIHTIITHKKPHWDEAVAILLLRLFGKLFFPGIESAKIVFWNAGSKTLDGRSAEEWEADGYLLVGAGGGRFDEHPSLKKERRRNDCAATLVAKFLGVDNDPALKVLLEYTFKMDSSVVRLGEEHKDLATFNAANLGKLIHKFYTNDDNIALEWMITGARAVYEEQKVFFAAKEEFHKNALVSEANIPRLGKAVLISAIESDSTSMSSLARSSHGNKSAVLIQKNSKGQVQVFLNKENYDIKLFDSVRLIRMAELQGKNGSFTLGLPFWNELSKEHGPEGSGEWFFMHSGQMVLNGSLTNPDAKPTSLSLDRIAWLVRKGILLSEEHGSCEAVCNCEFKNNAHAFLAVWSKIK